MTRSVLVSLFLAVLLLAACAASLVAGPAGLLIGSGTALDPQAADLILFELRVPRTLLAIAAGGVLGLGGAVLVITACILASWQLRRG